MTEERALAVLRAAERLGINALWWMPYSDEILEEQRTTWKRDYNQISDDLNFVRSVKKEVEEALLNVAEHKDAKKKCSCSMPTIYSSPEGASGHCICGAL
jgi:hypothetical protein